MVVVFGTKTNLAVEDTLFFREPNYNTLDMYHMRLVTPAKAPNPA